ncbi:MAG: hypothetical protein ACE5R4_09310 [Armatimonadota bacterium]
MDQLAALIWLKWKLTTASYRRSRSRLLVLALMVLFFLGPASVFISLGLLKAFLHGPEPMATELLHIALAGVWLLWVAAPVFGFSVTETHDISKQLVFPIPRLRMFLGALLGGFLDVPTLFLLPLFAVVVVGFARSSVAPLLTGLVLAIFLLQTLALGLSVLLLMLGVLRSRRFQDVLTVLAPVTGIGIYVLIQGLMSRGYFQRIKPFELEVSQYLVYTPGGLAARAIQEGAAGQYLPYLAFAGVLLAVTAATLWLGSYVMQRVYEGEIVDSYRVRRRPREAQPASRRRRWLPRLLSPQMEAVLVKELRYLWREPQMKSLLLTLLFPALWLVVVARGGFLPTGPYFAASVGLMCLFAGSAFAMNIFGFDRGGLNLLFLFPSDRRTLLLGKNALIFLITASAATVGVCIAAAWRDELHYVPTVLPFVYAVIVLVVAGGNVASVYYPQRIPARGENPYAQGMEKGCATAVVRALIVQAVMVVALPIAAGFLGPHLLGRPALYVITAPLALVYALAIYWGALPHLARALLQRETRIIEVCTTVSGGQ